jgi:hypothetical protein
MRWAPTFVVIAGAALRLWQYAADTSQWTDELALSSGILALDLRQLLTAPLPFQQVAPKGFLLVQKLAGAALGPSDYALRLFPLACSLTALAVFARLAARTLGGAATLAAVLLFATAAPFIASGALVKQFSTDVCVAVLLWWLAFELTARPLTPRRAAWAAVAGSAPVWFSQPGALMVAALGAALAVTFYGGRYGSAGVSTPSAGATAATADATCASWTRSAGARACGCC